jgi:hypothetical protein
VLQARKYRCRGHVAQRDVDRDLPDETMQDPETQVLIQEVKIG